MLYIVINAWFHTVRWLHCYEETQFTMETCCKNSYECHQVKQQNLQLPIHWPLDILVVRILENVIYMLLQSFHINFEYISSKTEPICSQQLAYLIAPNCAQALMTAVNVSTSSVCICSKYSIPSCPPLERCETAQLHNTFVLPLDKRQSARSTRLNLVQAFRRTPCCRNPTNHISNTRPSKHSTQTNPI